MDSYLEWLNQGITKESITTFIERYSQALIPPLIAFIQNYGIALYIYGKYSSELGATF
ncbi:hypothetical protein ACV566_07285 [Staphylococcus aureus]